MTAKKPFWMPVNVGQYLADTGHLTTLQHGAYWLLILHYWHNAEALPDDPRVLARLAKMTHAEWEENEDVLRALFRPSQCAWEHKRVEEELAIAMSRIATGSEKARNAANARWDKARAEQDDPANDDATSMHDASNGHARGMLGDAQLQLQSSVPKGTATGPHGIAGAKAAIFREGLAYLTANGVAEERARTLLGKWRAKAGDGPLLDLLGRAEAEGKSEPVAWIERTLKPKGHFSEAVI